MAQFIIVNPAPDIDAILRHAEDGDTAAPEMGEIWLWDEDRPFWRVFLGGVSEKHRPGARVSRQEPWGPGRGEAAFAKADGVPAEKGAARGAKK